MVRLYPRDESFEYALDIWYIVKEGIFIMSAIIELFKDKRNAFADLRQDASGYGWNLIPRELGKDLFEELRGGDNHDYVTVLVFSDSEEHVLDYIPVGTDEPTMKSAETMVDLKDYVVDNAPEDELTPADIRVCHDENGFNAVYAQGDCGLVAVGYYDNAKSSKGAMMCALMLYLFAYVNIDHDEALFNSVYNYLPFNKEVGLSYHFYEYADQLINETYLS